MNLFVTNEDLIELTGYQVGAKQAEWLRNNGYVFEISGNGRPKVLVQHLIEKMTKESQKAKPDFAVLKS